MSICLTVTFLGPGPRENCEQEMGCLTLSDFHSKRFKNPHDLKIAGGCARRARNGSQCEANDSEYGATLDFGEKPTAAHVNTSGQALPDVAAHFHVGSSCAARFGRGAAALRQRARQRLASQATSGRQFCTAILH